MKTEAKTEARLDCLVAGEANVDLLMNGVIELSPGEEKLADRMDLVLGGSSAITAFNLSRLGTRTGFTGIIGNDAFGDFVEARRRSGGVDLSGLRRHRTGRTGITIWHSKGNKRAGVTFPGTLALLQADLKRSRHLHMGHYFLLTHLHSGAPALFRKAKALSLSTSLDCNHDPTGQWDSNLRNTLRYADIFLPNELEALAITGERTAAAAARSITGAGGTAEFEAGR